ncbi:MAG: electron transport complex subunit RsxG [Gammaproteobacteria bacterium]|nr:electron transport complex subunit RsxG [Gammaproteobacteria bacterium]
MRADRVELLKNMARAAAIAAGFAIAGTTMVALTWEETQDDIAEAERRVLLNTLNQLVPADRYSNDLFSDTTTVRDEDMLGTEEPVTVYRARDDGKPVAALLTPVAPNGYSGDIDLLVAINYDGSLAGVRVLGHKETPGLGDLVERSKSDWLAQFDNASLAHPPLPEWKVKRDGGAFDQLTGATITPRAIVDAVRKTLLFYNGNRERIFSQDHAEAEPTTTEANE